VFNKYKGKANIASRVRCVDRGSVRCAVL